MVSMAKIHHHTPWPLQLSLNHSRPSFPKPISSLRPTQSPTKSLFIRASISDNLSSSTPNPKPSPLIQTTCAAIAAAAFFLARFNHCGAAIAATPVAPPPQESAEADADAEAEAEAEESLSTETDAAAAAKESSSIESSDVEELRSLMEEKIKANKLEEAIQALERLIALEPEDSEWPLLKANLYNYKGDYDLARAELEEILKKDPLRIEAFHGLAMVASDSSDGDPGKVEEVCQRVVAALKVCEKQKKRSEVRDFKLLIAQIKVMESKYSDALKLYQELVKEEPRDYRPYLCQGIVYTLLKKKNEAEEQFGIFRRLVPKDHPFREYLEDNMFATKLMSAQREAAGSRT